MLSSDQVKLQEKEMIFYHHYRTMKNMLHLKMTIFIEGPPIYIASIYNTQKIRKGDGPSAGGLSPELHWELTGWMLAVARQWAASSTLHLPGVASITMHSVHTSPLHNTTQIHNHQPSAHQHSNQTLIQSCHYCNPHLHLVSTVNTSHHFLQWLTSYIQFYFFYFHYFSWNIKHYIMNWILPRDVSSSFII